MPHLLQYHSVQLGQKECMKAIVSMLFQMIWRPIVGCSSDPEDVTTCESEDAAMADLHEFDLGRRASVQYSAEEMAARPGQE